MDAAALFVSLSGGRQPGNPTKQEGGEEAGSQRVSSASVPYLRNPQGTAAPPQLLSDYGFHPSSATHQPTSIQLFISWAITPFLLLRGAVTRVEVLGKGTHSC